LGLNGVNNDVNNEDSEEIEKINSSSTTMADSGDEEETDTNFESFSHALFDHIQIRRIFLRRQTLRSINFGNLTIFLP